MKRTRQVLAIALVATALCADRAVASAPSLRPQVSSAAGKLVTRLSVSFKRVVPAVRVYENRRDGAVSQANDFPVRDLPVAVSARLSPLLLRLPPPAL
jgi:hypothetical protein